MNKTLKRIVLISLFALFFIIGGITIFYAQGYRFDTTSLSIQKVGAIFIKTIPGEAAVTIDGEPVDKSYWLFNSGKLIQSLFPKDYQIVVSYPKYRTINLNIKVLPSLVSELSHVLLIPEQNEAVINEVYQAEGLLSKDFPLLKTVNQNLYFGGSKIGKYEPVSVSSDGLSMLANNKTGLYYVKRDRDDVVSVTTSTLTLTPKDAVYLLDEKNQKVFAFTKNKIYSIQEKTKATIIYSATSTITTPTSKLNRLAWAEQQNGKGVIVVYNKSNDNSETFKLDEQISIASIKWQTDNQILIQSMNGDIYLYPLGSATLNKITSEAILSDISLDSKKIATVGRNRLELFMENGKYLRVDVSSLGIPEKLSWIQDSGHLIYKASGKIYLIDIDTPVVENFQLVNEADNFWYDAAENIIYIHRNANLERIKLEN